MEVNGQRDIKPYGKVVGESRKWDINFTTATGNQNTFLKTLIPRLAGKIERSASLSLQDNINLYHFRMSEHGMGG